MYHDYPRAASSSPSTIRTYWWMSQSSLQIPLRAQFKSEVDERVISGWCILNIFVIQDGGDAAAVVWSWQDSVWEDVGRRCSLVSLVAEKHTIQGGVSVSSNSGLWVREKLYNWLFFFIKVLPRMNRRSCRKRLCRFNPPTFLCLRPSLYRAVPRSNESLISAVYLS